MSISLLFSSSLSPPYPLSLTLSPPFLFSSPLSPPYPLPLPLILSLSPSLPLTPSPSYYSLRPIDVEFMKHLHGYVNIVPVIAKADTLTIEERDSFKQRIREDLNFHGISIYPSAYGAEDEEDASANAKIEVREWVHWRLGDSWSLLLPSLPSSLPPSSLPPPLSLLPPSLLSHSLLPSSLRPPSLPISLPPSLPPAIHPICSDWQRP